MSDDDMFCPRCEEWVNPDTHACFKERRKQPPFDSPLAGKEFGKPKILLLEFDYARQIHSEKVDWRDFKPGVSRCEIVGFLVAETEDAFVLANLSIPMEGARLIHVIPKSCVKTKSTFKGN